ncbi:MAG: molybdopterin cofactor-binding domain-containing protein [Saprospiraceae bacterium]
MSKVKTSVNRRSFLKASALTGGGMLLGFSWLASCKPTPEQVLAMPKEWFDMNGFLKIGDNGRVTIQSPNPEIGQNVKTSMPMIVAEELDIDWKQVIVEQAPLNTAIFKRQLAGGSQSIRQGWDSLRMAGGTARHLLKQAAANAWEVPFEEVTTSLGVLSHTPSGKTAGYGEMAAAAALLEVPEEIELKKAKDFGIIGTSRKNVDAKKIVTGKPLFGIDYQVDGMLTASIVHAPAFGMRLKSSNLEDAKAMPGVKDVFVIDTYPEGMDKQWCDTDAYPELVVVVGASTWQVMQAKKALKLEWESAVDLENTADHIRRMNEEGAAIARVARKDGDVDAGFAKAVKTIERTYTAPFLAHNCMEPMNFFANVTADKAELVGPVQTPEFMEKSIAARLGMTLEQVDLQMTRMGGGFGRRLYGHFVVEAAVISQKMGAPVKLIYSREDDMTFGTYRPAYHAYYKAGLDADNNVVAFHVRAGGIPESPLAANRFPAGAIDNYLAEEWALDSNITTGAFRAPRSNFIAGAEQSFLDEVAEAAGKDPIDFRVELLERAEKNPVGEKNDYEAPRYAEVLRVIKEKAGTPADGIARGVSAYYCHNSYVANVLDMTVQDVKPVVEKVFAVVDCGIVVNPDAATNMVEGGTVDGIGHALYSGLTFKDGVPEQTNFDKYRLIRHREAPKSIEVHFIDNGIDPTGLGEPPFPPIMGAVANALYKATGKRFYDQPYVREVGVLG